MNDATRQYIAEKKAAAEDYRKKHPISSEAAYKQMREHWGQPQPEENKKIEKKED